MRQFQQLFLKKIFLEPQRENSTLEIYLKKKINKKSLSLPQAIHLGRCPRPA